MMNWKDYVAIFMMVNVAFAVIYAWMSLAQHYGLIN